MRLCARIFRALLRQCLLSSTSGGRGRSRETEDGRTPWRLSGLSSKKGKLWLILATLHPPLTVYWPRILNCTYFSFYALYSRNVCPFRSRFRFSLFFARVCFSVDSARSWKRLGCSWLGQGFQCSGNGRVLNFACREGKECGTYEGN